MNRLCFVLLCLPLAGCAIRFNSQPEPAQQFEKTRIIAVSFDEAWSRAISWFASQNFSIDKIEKPSGFITAKYLIEVSDEAVAGEVTVSGLVYGSPEVRRFADLNILLNPVAASQTEVTVNLFGTYEATAWWGWLAPNYLVTGRGRLPSTGKLERSFLDYIDVSSARQRVGGAVGPTFAQAPDERSPSSSGTGFFVTANGFLVTNHHVAPEGAAVKVLTKQGLLPAIVVRSHASDDLSLLKVEGEFQPLPVISSRSVRLGATVATVGFPNVGLQGFSPKLAKGEVAGLAGVMDDPRYFQISTPIQPGNSGGALVDDKGNVVAVVAARLDKDAAVALTGRATENVNYAVKSGYLLPFLESVPSALSGMVGPNLAPMPFEEVVDRVEAATVLVLVY